MRKGRAYEQTTMVLPGICLECEAPGKHRHHVVPASVGGRRIVWLCEACHEKVHAFAEGQFERMRTARNKLAARGGYAGGYRFARKYGQKLVTIDGRLRYQPVLEEQEIIKRICTTCKNGSGYQQIATTLNKEGAPTITGAAWSKTMVRKLAVRGPHAKNF